jgi:hypothetical protein
MTTPPILHELDALERDLRAMRIEFERFFAGTLDVPPEGLFLELALRIRDLRTQTRGVVESFRLGSLEAQFNSYREMFQRRLRNKELGMEGPRPQQPAEAAAPSESESEKPDVDPRQGVVIGERVSSAVAEALHRELREGGSRLGRVDTATLAAFLERQAADLRARTGCANVRFRVVYEDGELRLKARPEGTRA